MNEQLAEAIQGIEQFLADLNTGYNNLINGINNVLDSIPGYLRWSVNWIFDFVKKVCSKIWDLMKKIGTWIAENVWPVIKGPFTLISTAGSWDHAHGPASTAEGNIGTQNTAVDDYWSGPAQTAYLQIIPSQQKACAVVKDITTEMADALRECAGILIGIYVALLALLVLAIAQIFGGVAACCTVVGIPPGAAAIITGVLTALAGGGALWAGASALLNGTLQKFGEFTRTLESGEGLTNGKWPPASGGGADIGDGSNPGTGWSYRR